MMAIGDDDDDESRDQRDRHRDTTHTTDQLRKKTLMKTKDTKISQYNNARFKIATN